MAPPLVCMSTSNRDLARHDDKNSIFRFWEGARSKEFSIVGHNFAYDTAVFCAAYSDLIPIIFDVYRIGIHDTMIRQMLLDLKDTGLCRPRSLADLSSLWIGETLDKGSDTWRKRYYDLRDVAIADWPENARTYAIKDALMSYSVFLEQGSGASPADVFDNEFDRTRAHFAYKLMATYGLKTDVEYVEKHIHDGERLLDELASNLQAAGIMKPGTRSITKNQIIKRLEASGIVLPETEKGNKQIDKTILALSDDLEIKNYAQFKSTQHELKNYLYKYRDGLVQCDSNPLLTNGRLSLSRPPLQNLPRSGAVRESFIARPGKVLCSVDYEGVELRTLAQAELWLTGRSKLAQVFQQDAKADVHTMLAATLLRIPLDEAYRRKKEDPTFKSYRQKMKAANFGFGGGMGPDKFVLTQKKSGLTFTVAEAHEIKQAYLRQWDLTSYFNYANRTAQKGFMKCLVSNRYRATSVFTDHANGYFSSLMADGSAAAMFEIVRQQYAVPSSPIYGTRLVCAVHDESLTELDKDGAHEQAYVIRDIMCNTMMSKYTPDVPITAEPALMLRWNKDATEEFDKTGRLIPWEKK